MAVRETNVCGCGHLEVAQDKGLAAGSCECGSEPLGSMIVEVRNVLSN
jgi:hypothetical protein